MDGFDALGQVKDVFHFSTLSSSNNLDVDNRIPWGEKITLNTWQSTNVKITCNNKENNNKKLSEVVLKFFKGRNTRHIGEELIPVSSSSWEKGKLGHICLTMGNMISSFAIPFAVPARQTRKIVDNMIINKYFLC